MTEKISLKILTYNIHKGFSMGPKRFVLHQMKDALIQTGADLVFLQEIHGEQLEHEEKIEQWPAGSQFEFLADQIWQHYAYGKNAIYKEGHHGNAILSKYPFHLWENIDVAIHKRASRSLLHGVISIPETQIKLHVICIHLGLFRVERDQQLMTLCERIESHVPKNEPLIIAGDFNDWRSHAQSPLEIDMQLKEVFKILTGEYAKTFPAIKPALAVDRIYYRNLHLKSGHRLTGGPWDDLSDHVPLMAEFEIK